MRSKELLIKSQFPNKFFWDKELFIIILNVFLKKTKAIVRKCANPSYSFKSPLNKIVSHSPQIHFTFVPQNANYYYSLHFSSKKKANVEYSSSCEYII